MSRIDNWAKASADGGGLLRSWRRSRAASVPQPEVRGISRRDLMKKAGVVGGATLFAAPLIQSVTAPAYAASFCTPNCANGVACTLPTECASGYCNPLTMVCANPPIGQGIANGTACGTGTEMQQDQSCTSGYCNASNVCQAPPGNVTTGNTCHGGTTTAANGNCATGNTCDDYNAVSGTGVCRKVTGQSCQNKGECASDTCAALVPSGPKFCG